MVRQLSTRTAQPGWVVADTSLDSLLPAMLNVGDFTVGVWLGTAHEELLDQPAAATFTLHGSNQGRPDRVVTSRSPSSSALPTGGMRPVRQRTEVQPAGTDPTIAG